MGIFRLAPEMNVLALRPIQCGIYCFTIYLAIYCCLLERKCYLIPFHPENGTLGLLILIGTERWLEEQALFSFPSN